MASQNITSWETLWDLKESNPIEDAEYAIANNFGENTVKRISN
jgi:hypothetical protein